MDAFIKQFLTPEAASGGALTGLAFLLVKILFRRTAQETADTQRARAETDIIKELRIELQRLRDEVNDLRALNKELREESETNRAETERIRTYAEELRVECERLRGLVQAGG